MLALWASSTLILTAQTTKRREKKQFQSASNVTIIQTNMTETMLSASLLSKCQQYCAPVSRCLCACELMQTNLFRYFHKCEKQYFIKLNHLE